MLEGLIKDINFVKGSKFEKKGKNLLVRNSDRTTLQENLEKYFKSKKISFERRKKPTELRIDGFDSTTFAFDRLRAWLFFLSFRCFLFTFWLILTP